MSKVLVPARSPDDWRELLADPDKHWRKEYSAWAIAHSWQSAKGFPPTVAKVLGTSPTDAVRDAEPLLVLPEHKVPLPGGVRASQNDVWVLARSTSSGELLSIAVEGKVAERFGSESLDEWLRGASPGKLERLEYLRQQLGLPAELPGGIRYQLLHRAASAVIEARRFNAGHAILLVHSFSDGDMWFDDYAEFAGLFGVNPAPDTVHAAGRIGSLYWHVGWVRGDPTFLT